MGSTSAKTARGQAGGVARTVCDRGAMERAGATCEDAMRRCFPLDRADSRISHARLTRDFCRPLDCRIRAAQLSALQGRATPVVVLAVLILFACVAAFSCTVFCVNESEDIFQALKDCGLAGADLAKTWTRARNGVRERLGCDRIKGV
mmetsp:Transcript_28038/g.81266  ORF Transcript_28038/g.81266 Transcript_28038/m.81266 type:complete len:148 (-) Transcript_28038:96-539(-)